MAANLTPIPQPPTIPFLGNALLIEQDVPLRSFQLLAQQYGEIFQMSMPGGRTVIHCNSYALVRQLSDDRRFKKPITGGLRELRRLVGDGLFTAELEEPNWGVAHRVLMPTFSATNVRAMFDDMKDICSQMILKWERFGPDHVFEPTEDYTRLTLDTIALCAMSLRFNSFYTPTMPPFVQAMFDVLLESGKRAIRPAVVSSLPLLYRSTNEKYERDIKFLTSQAQEILENRKSHPIEKKDLLALMLSGKDPKTGQTMTEESIIYNLITFLIAGHETTSGMLSFTTYYLLKNPEAMQKLRNEIDSVCGDREVTLEDLGKMPYLLAVMRESMRLSPTAPLRAVVPIIDANSEPCVLIGGDGDASNPQNKRYLVPPGTSCVVQSGTMMRDARVWGEDAEKFRPERMLDGGFENLPPQAWQPFGFGMRACIGRPFAWQEAQLVLAAVFQKFDLFLADPSYTLQIKQALTIKPKGLMVRAVPRRKIVPSPSIIPRSLSGEGVTGAALKEESLKGGKEGGGVVSGMRPVKTVHVLYGSNTGTCEGLAQRVVSDARSKGFAAKLATLDSVAGKLPKDEEGPVVIITASFEGEPADNAAHFFQWLQSLQTASLSSSSAPLKGTSFAVFGCGNREWASTYQRIPRLVDELLNKSGAERIFKRGEADVSAASFFEDWEEWEGEMWKTLGERYHVEKNESLATDDANALQVDIVDVGTTRARLLRQPDAGIGRVMVNRKLTKEGAPVKRHIEIELPEGMTYRAGDYLAILPTNPDETVERVIARFKLHKHSEVVINSNVPTTFPTNVPLPITDLLSGYIELSQPATTRDLQTLLALTESSSIQSTLTKLRENYQDLVLSKRLSVLDILEDNPSLDIPFATFLRFLPPMRVRQYSISSSPLVSPQRVSLTVSVVDAPALSNTSRRYLGVASNCLSNLKASDCIPVVVRPSGAAFHLPNDSSVPTVMFCAGSGLAPFKGFVEERAAQKASGRDVGKMLLFFGCRAPDEDYLYMTESGDEALLRKWVEEGVVDVRPAFSRRSDASLGCKYVQDRILHDRSAVSEFYDLGAKFYTCGSRKAANGIRLACINIIKGNNSHMSDHDAEKAFEKVQKERYATDIFD